MDSLLAKFQTADKQGDQWPPKHVTRNWQLIKSYRARYENVKSDLLSRNRTMSMDQHMRELFTPVPLAREICRFSTALLFSETPKVTITDYEDLVADIIRVSDFGAFATEGGQLVACEGSCGVRIVIDPDISKFPILTLVPEDQVIWNERHGRFTLGGIVIADRTITKGKSTVYYRMLEEHLPGSVERKLFESTEPGFLGKEVPLSTLPEFANVEPYFETGLDHATLIRWYNVPGGESDLFGLEEMFDELNEAETGFRDKAKKSTPRLFVDKSLFDDVGRAWIDGIIPVGRGRVQPALGADPSKLINMHQGKFDAQEQLTFTAHVMQMIVTCAGYAPMTWGIQGQTANVTRAVSGYAMKLAQLRTLLTRSQKEHMALEALGWSIATCIAWQSDIYEVQTCLPTIELGDGLPNDPLDGAQEVLFLRQAMAASTEELVKIIHPTFTPAQIEAEAQAILTEAAEGVMGGTGQGVGNLSARIAGVLNGPATKAGDGSDAGNNPVD